MHRLFGSRMVGSLVVAMLSKNPAGISTEKNAQVTHVPLRNVFAHFAMKPRFYFRRVRGFKE